MFGARHFWCATAGLLAQLAFAALGHGSELASTVRVSSNISDARMTRALVLIRGELSALGLDVQVRNAETSEVASAATDATSERLSLEVRDGVVVVRVFTAGAALPLVESVDLDGPEVTAEVIAVRAVEALRAARLLPPSGDQALAPKAPLVPASAAPASVPASTAPLEPPLPMLQLSLGPTLVQNGQGLPQLNAQAAVRVGPRWGFIALGAEGSLSKPNFENEAGSARVSRRVLFIQLGARARVRRAWEVSARSGLSYLHYTADGAADPGYLARELSHGTGAVSLSVGGAYYFVRAFGVYLDISGLVAFDAARVRLANQSVVTPDQPSIALGLGALLGAF